MVHNRRWGQSYRSGRPSLFTPMNTVTKTESRPTEDEEGQNVVYIEHFRDKAQLSRNP